MIAENSADSLSVFFLSQDEQTADAVIARLTAFLAAARETLEFCLYDMRLSDALKKQIVSALQQRAAAGVKIRICYDGDKPFVPNLAAGQDPAPAGTGAFVHSLGYPSRRIAGMKLMHNKFIVRDRTAVWTGSLNLTDNAFTLMENNVVQVESAPLAAYYLQDFEQLWEKENFEDTGNIKTEPVPLTFAGHPATARAMFSPGCGLEIDTEIARRVHAAQRRVRICSLLINSGTLISALTDLLNEGRVGVSGIYDRTQMADVYRQWQEVPQNRWKIPALRDVIARAKLAGKNSTPYTPTGRHDFMHNKILVIDDTVITGSYNFSRSAQYNAENILFIESAALADTYSAYIDHLMEKYSASQ
ncbi:MAG TPA: phosphatidylserine/phosphatidylglycerophosphate/cardiolipin synthase family protein [Chthoniobacterales bacterium]|nr:phosphatidylserine/phosphatidylglycerophosphate/cardiolipin synthase family protein [Chthoniobacterales bacterium]